MKKLLILTLSLNVFSSLTFDKPIVNKSYCKTQQYELDVKLREAVKNNNISSIRYLIHQGADVNYLYDDYFQKGIKRNILSDAIDSKSFDVVKLLLYAGASVANSINLLGDYRQIINKTGTSCFLPLSYAIIIEAPISIIELLAEFQVSQKHGLYFNNKLWYPCDVAKLCGNEQAITIIKNIESDLREQK